MRFTYRRFETRECVKANRTVIPPMTSANGYAHVPVRCPMIAADTDKHYIDFKSAPPALTIFKDVLESNEYGGVICGRCPFSQPVVPEF